MGTHRTPEQLKSIIMKGTQHIVAEGGMINFSFPRLTAETGISAPTVYEHYKNKEDLLTTCFMTIDNEVSSMITSMLSGMPSKISDMTGLENLCWILWISYWNYLTAAADRTLFYWSFYNSHYYTPEIHKKRDGNFETFLGFVSAVDERFLVSRKCNIRMLVANMIDGTVSMAVKVLKGFYPNDDVTAHTVYSMVFQPVFSMLDIKNEEKGEK